MFPRGYRLVQPSVFVGMSVQISGEIHVFEGNGILGDWAGDLACFRHV